MVHRMDLTIFSLCLSVRMGPLLNQQLGISLFYCDSRTESSASFELFLAISQTFAKFHTRSDL